MEDIGNAYIILIGKHEVWCRTPMNVPNQLSDYRFHNDSTYWSFVR
jgi:hypothetical protein